MGDLGTLSGQRSANEIIVVYVERLHREGLELRLDFQDQELIFSELIVRIPPTSAGLVFDRLKIQVERKNRLIDLRRSEVDVKRLATYIGYLRGYWNHREPDPDEELIERYKDDYYGIDISIRQPSGSVAIAVCFNPSEQRFVYSLAKRGLSSTSICDSLVEKKAEEAQKANETQEAQLIKSDSVQVLMNYMARQVQQPPQADRDHWARISEPYKEELGDQPTTLRRRLPQAPSIPEPATRPVTGVPWITLPALSRGNPNAPGQS